MSGQKLRKPGIEAQMEQKPRWRAPRYKPAAKLEGKVALVTGGDSGIGRAVAYMYAREGADVAITYLEAEQVDADEVRAAIEEEGRQCLLLPGDLAQPEFCREAVARVVEEWDRIDILVANAAYQERKHKIEEIREEEWEHTFKVNMEAYFHLVKAAVPHMKPGASIIATSSEVALRGSEALLDYGATKGAMIAFTKGLAAQLAKRGIRANVVAPGPIWTPLNPADGGASREKLEQFGSEQMLKRPGQPEELAPAYVFLASDADSSYVTGIVLEETGGLQ
jgi:NAD(P)-dependent dehydrogenase (short-subunit alcohol dehydrogenase family)